MSKKSLIISCFTEHRMKDCFFNYNEMLIDIKKNKFDGRFTVA